MPKARAGALGSVFEAIAAAQPRLKIDEAAFTQPTLESVFLDVAERYDTPADEGAVV